MESLGGTRGDLVSAVVVREELGFRSSEGCIAKRAFDIWLSTFALVCSLPILIVASILIRLQSPGSPIFLQRRVGKNGKVFNIFKLRTMYAGSDTHAFKTAADDARLTPIGKVLRNTNIDELPQLLNIILGDMGIIGPRPLSVDETNYLSKQLHLDLDYPGLVPRVRPGLIGLEQINRDKELTYLDRFAYNHDYETHWTGAMDFYIFLRAVVICRSTCIAASLGAVILLASIVSLGAH